MAVVPVVTLDGLLVFSHFVVTERGEEVLKSVQYQREDCSQFDYNLLTCTTKGLASAGSG